MIDRWTALKRSAADRRKDFEAQQKHLTNVEALYLEFAKKASAFNSWFENAEEDLTDPFRCSSIEEVEALDDQLAKFIESLKDAQAEFETLQALDSKIKSFGTGPNPYTWFTMESIGDTWRNLKKIVKERSQDLQEEHERQIENDRMRKEFALAAEAFHKWLNDAR